jgi:uncharacterized membrane protein YvbJ
MRMWIAILIGTVVALFVVSVWHGENAQKREVQALTDQFWSAVTTGDTATVASLLTPDTTVSASVLLEENAGMTYTHEWTEITRMWESSCGLRIMVSTLVRDSEHRSQARMMMLKRVDGRWLVNRGDGQICP